MFSAKWSVDKLLAYNDHSIGTLDDLLDLICVELQLTPTQFREAEDRYGAIGRWLGDGESPLSDRVFRIYPQGSMALGTTVRPRDHEEFDLDLILLVRHDGGPLELRNASVKRMRSNAMYADKLDLRRPRCIRVLYERQFYLDIVPARPDGVRGGNFIEVPDKDSGQWITGNPLQYVHWFESRCRVAILEKAAQDPLPQNGPAEHKPVLKRAVQLLKRRRDVVFDGTPEAPSSIVLTTLAGHFYRSEENVVGALDHILAATEVAINRARPGRLMLHNPANADECLTDRWTDESYRNFADFICQFRAELERLQEQVGQGLPAIEAQLKRLFDEKGVITSRALNAFAKNLQERRRAGALRATSQGLALGVGRAIPRNTHYGR
jgi:hypothetical protein